MSKKRSKSKKSCKHCGNKLKKYSCWNCHGEGKQRSWLFFKKTCEYCAGKGFIKRCPDQKKHRQERLKLSPEFSSERQLKSLATHRTKVGKLGHANRLRKPILKKPNRKIHAYPAWHPGNPNTSHPAHPRNINNPANPLSRNNPHNPNNPRNIAKRHRQNKPIHRHR